MKIKCIYKRNIYSDEILRLLLDAHRELIDLGYTDSDVLIKEEQEAIVAYVPQRKSPVGVISFGEYGAHNIWVYIIYVIPEFREKGILKAMMSKLEKVCFNNDSEHIYEGTHIDNWKALKAIEKINFKNLYIISKKKVGGDKK